MHPHLREGPAVEPRIAIQHLGLAGTVRIDKGHAERNVLRQGARQIRREPLALLSLRPDGGVLAAAVPGVKLRRHALHVALRHRVRLKERLAGGEVRVRQGRAVVGGDGVLFPQQLLHPVHHRDVPFEGVTDYGKCRAHVSEAFLSLFNELHRLFPI